MSIYDEIQAERHRQDAKWGKPSHPSVDDALMHRPGGCTPQRMAEEYEIPSATRAKFICQNNARWNKSTWTDITVEELAEAVEAATEGDYDNLRVELIQATAVLVQWIEDLDRGGGRA